MPEIARQREEVASFHQWMMEKPRRNGPVVCSRIECRGLTPFEVDLSIWWQSEFPMNVGVRRKNYGPILFLVHDRLPP